MARKTKDPRKRLRKAGRSEEEERSRRTRARDERRMGMDKMRRSEGPFNDHRKEIVRSRP